MKRTSSIAALVGSAAILLGTGTAWADSSSLAQATRRAALAPVSVAVGTARLQEDQPDRELFFPGPIVRVGQDYSVRAGEVVRDLRVVFGDLTLAGRVERDVVVVFGTVHATSTAVVDGSVIVIGGGATIEPGASVRRDFVVLGGSLSAPPDFVPGGEHVAIGSPALGNALRQFEPWLLRGLLWGRPIVPGLGWVWMVVGVAFLVYLAINILFDGGVRTASDIILDKPASAFFSGMLVLVLTVPVLVILAVTVVGLAVIPFVLCVMFLAGLVGKAAVARAIGRRLVAQSSADSKLQGARSFLFGSAVICLAYMVPVLGVVTWTLTGLLAIGAVSVAFARRLRRERGRPKERAVAAASGSLVPPPLVEETVSGSIPEPPLASEPPLAQDGADVPPTRPVAGALAACPRATFFDRVVAFALDCVLVGIAVAVLDLSRYDGAFPLLLLVYSVVFWAWRGTTLGGIIVGLRILRTDGGEQLRFVDAVVRGLSSVFSLAALGIGCFWMLQDPARQMWHDKVAGTIVAKVPRTLLLP